MGLIKLMKTGFNKTFIALTLLLCSMPVFAMPGSIIATYLGMTATVAGVTTLTAAGIATAFAINMVASAIISKALYNSNQPSSDYTDPGNRQTVTAATNNKLPVVYGKAYVGGSVIDVTMTPNNQAIYYVIALSEVTGNGTDNITFGKIYFGGKECIFDPVNTWEVTGLYDESTGTTQSAAGCLRIFLYNNGSYSPTNSPYSAIDILSSKLPWMAYSLGYEWNNYKLMTNCAFAIVGIRYVPDRGFTSLQPTQFEITNSRYKPGECFYDYMTNSVYGAGIPVSQIDTASLDALDVYSNQSFTYTNYSGGSTTQTRFRFDGVIDTNQPVMTNLQTMSASCDCLLRYNEIYAKWGVIVQSPTYSIAMDLNDTNLVSAIQITPIDISSSYNIIECKFPDAANRDTFNTATFDLAEIAPSLLYPNEPVNKQSISLALVNNDVRAQYICTRILKSAREDLQIQVVINYQGLQLEAGDIVTLTNANYGWVAKEFRINKVTETFTESGEITAKLMLSEFNAAIYDDSNITQFQPSPNTGIGNPLGFGTIFAPSIIATYPSAAIPSIVVQVTTATNGITQYAEIWYSAFSTPTEEQRIFAGTSEIQSNGSPWNTNTVLPNITLTNIPAGNWYFFTRMVNSLGASDYSSASSVVTWRPLTFQYTDRYLSVRYADSITGTGFSTNPRNKTYYGLQNVPVATGSSNASDYTWYAGTFGTDNYLLFANRTNRKFSFAVGGAGYFNLGGAFVPSDTSTYDSSVWGALVDGINYIDLDQRTGQLTQAGTTGYSSADGLLNVANNTDGSMIVKLDKFLNFGSGVYQKTFNAATLTIDVYGRVVGYTEPDSFYYTETNFLATGGQTTFSISHTVGNILVFRDGLLLSSSDYTETSTTVVLSVAATAGEIITVINMRAVSTNQYYEILGTAIVSSTSNTVVYDVPTYQIINAGDLLCFAATQPDPTATPTTFAVSSVNTSTKTITFTTTISGATATYNIYRKRAASSTYPPFSRYEIDVSGITSYTPTTFSIANGFEQIYVNGVQLNEIDYDLAAGSIQGLPGPVTGKMVIIMYSPNNFNVPASNITNTVTYSVNGQATYSFPCNPLAMEIYANGVLLLKDASYDYTANATGYTLTTAIPNSFTLLNQQTFARIGAA